ncbi:nucleotidyltransferase family protein [Cohnella faecalis]|uniref:nucleotidyltransferase domain-containing protein n=1 Tax=Cohnella faecalis TaxID=2315694 RepID=UPI001314595D|nr:nucleotidyltransferase family protein [Cohnella faecalis]
MVATLLRFLYDKETPAPHNEAVYRGFLEEIELFGIASQVLTALQQSGKTDQVPEDFVRRLKRYAEPGRFRNIRIQWFERQLFRIFEQANIPVVPLKGIQFAANYFGHFTARSTGDIDLLVRPEQLQDAIEWLKAFGYRHEETIHNHAVLRKAVDGAPLVELHWTLDKPGWSELDPEPFWRDSAPLGQFRFVRELSVTHTFYAICLHGVRHRMESLRYLLDIAQMLYRFGSSIDYAELFAQAAADRTVNRLKAALSIVYRVFPKLDQLKPLPFEPRRTLWSYPAIRDARLRVKSVRYYKYRLYFKLFIFDTWKHGWHARRRITSKYSEYSTN